MGSAMEEHAKWREIVANTGTNWPDYKQLMEAWALKNKSIEILKGKSDISDPNYMQKRHELYFLILSSQTNKTRHLLRTVETGDAETAWKRLKDHFESTTKASIKQQLRTLVGLRQGNMTVPEFISKAEELTQRLEAAIRESNVELLDILLQSVVIDGLDAKYATLQQTLMLDDRLNSDSCIAHILEATQRIDFNSAQPATPKLAKTPETNAKVFSCSLCHTNRHNDDDCWKQHPDKRPKKKPVGSTGKAPSANASTANWRVALVNSAAVQVNAIKHAPGTITFNMDSGAMKHFTNSLHGLTSFDPSRKLTVELADKTRLQTEGTGAIAGKLNEIVYSPKFGMPLLSIYQLYQSGKATIFHPTKGIYVTDANKMHFTLKGRPDLIGYTTDNGFEAQIRVQNTKPAIVNTALAPANEAPKYKTNDPRLWIMRLGYPSPERILDAVRNNLAYGIPIAQSTTPADFAIHEMDEYHLGKTKSRPHHAKPPGTKTSTKPFEQLHIDIKVTNTRTLGGNKYLLVIVDEFTRWREAIPMPSKGTTVDAFKNWYLLFVKNLGHTTSRIRCDNAKENIALRGFARAHSIKMEFTNKYSSQSNGLAERSIGILSSTIRTLLTASKLPQELWGEAALTAAYLVNRLPTTSNPNSKTPYEMVYGHRPNWKHLVTFGCKAYVHHNKGDGTHPTFGPTAKVGICVGYARDTNGYRIMLPDKSIIETADVHFTETNFPGMNDYEEESNDKFEFHSCDEDEPDQEHTAPEATIIIETAPGPVNSTPNNELPEDTPQANQSIEDLLSDELRADDHTIEDEILPPRTRKPPPHLKDYVYRTEVTYVRAAKVRFEDAVNDPLIKESMRQEIKQLLESGAIKVTDLPPGRRAIKSTWAHKRKVGPSGEFLRYKSRICPYGFQQIPGIDYDEDRVASPTLHIETAMTVLAIEAQRGMHSTVIDADSAFATTPNHTTTYMEFPEGMKRIPGKALLLVHSLNGSKQGAYDWNARAHDALIELGLKQSISDPCLYFRWDSKDLTMVALFVDDFRIISDKRETMELVKLQLQAKFKMKDAPESLWLGLQILKSNEGIKINCKTKIANMLETFGLRDCKPMTTPAAPGTKLIPARQGTAAQEKFPYREAVGALLWIARTARPDILYATTECAKFCHAYDDTHISAVKRIFRYLKYSSDRELTFRRADNFNLSLYVDANYAGEGSEGEQPMRSTSGAILMVNDVGPIMAMSKLQPTVARSTAEAEYAAIGVAIQASLIIINLVKEINIYCQESLQVYNDNQAAIFTYRNKTAGSQLRHVLINYHFVKELIEQNKIRLDYLETEHMPADIFTKAVSREVFDRHCFTMF